MKTFSLLPNINVHYSYYNTFNLNKPNKLRVIRRTTDYKITLIVFACLICFYVFFSLLFIDGTLIKCEKTYEMCEGCGQKIHDRYLMRVGDASWHEHCLSCSICGVLLNHSCYTRNTKLYCKSDYDR